jgi:hypothetical protein
MGVEGAGGDPKDYPGQHNKSVARPMKLDTGFEKGDFEANGDAVNSRRNLVREEDNGLEAGDESMSFGEQASSGNDLVNENPERDIETYNRAYDETALFYSLLVTQVPVSVEHKILSKLWRASTLKTTTQAHRLKTLFGVRDLCRLNSVAAGAENAIMPSLIGFLTNGLAEADSFPELGLDPNIALPSIVERDRSRCYEGLINLKQRFQDLRKAEINATNVKLEDILEEGADEEFSTLLDKQTSSRSCSAAMMGQAHALTQRMGARLSPLRFNACVEELHKFLKLKLVDDRSLTQGWDKLVEGLKRHAQMQSMHLIPLVEDFLLDGDIISGSKAGNSVGITEEERKATEQRWLDDNQEMRRQQDIALHVLMNARRGFLNEKDPDFDEPEYEQLMRKRSSSHSFAYRLATMLKPLPYCQVYELVMKFELSATRRDIKCELLRAEHVEKLRKICEDEGSRAADWVEHDDAEFNAMLPNFYEVLDNFYFEHFHLAKHEALCRGKNLALRLTAKPVVGKAKYTSQENSVPKSTQLDQQPAEGEEREEQPVGFRSFVGALGEEASGEEVEIEQGGVLASQTALREMRTIFVSNLPDALADNQLQILMKKTFARCGEVHFI